MVNVSFGVVAVAVSEMIVRFVLTVDASEAPLLDEHRQDVARRRGRGPSPCHLFDEDVLGDAGGLLRRRIVSHRAEQRRAQSVDIGAAVGCHT